MTDQELRNKIKEFEKFTAVSLNDKRKVRCKLEPDGIIFVFAKGKSKYGYRYTDVSFLQLFEPYLLDDEELEKKWHKKCAKIEKKLEVSGLWPEYKEIFHNLQLVSYKDWKKIRSVSPSDEKEILSLTKEKYPFMLNDNGYINYSYLWGAVEGKTKTMFFGSLHKSYKNDIEKALKERKKYRTGRIRANYDVSFEYDAEKNKAWYSEEYRDCGNGHYYIAIDSSTALFCEDD